ncbi:6091_t:CDS:1 [Gigaspora margarita]|uniref:6091_t:CDS:1 n=1 Tax=Gigaspora margarita TaxID=4874 RepID=A0ABN7WRR4_GIGMA|nr:6091_t:CDS:1 [Gigaspora margarita]
MGLGDAPKRNRENTLKGSEQSPNIMQPENNMIKIAQTPKENGRMKIPTLQPTQF